MARRDAYLDHLAAVPMFASCSRQELTEIGRRTEEITVKAGATLVKQGSSSRELFLIVDGEATVDRDGKKVAKLGPGDHFGELGIFERLPRSASVVADTELDVLVLDRPQFHGLLSDVPNIARAVLRNMASRLREADARSVQ